MDDKRINLLKNEKISTAVNKMALPAIIGFLTMAVYNFVDSMYVSWIGYEAVAAAQVLFPLMMLTSSIGLGFGTGGGTYISRLLGRKNYERAGKVITVTLLSALMIGFVYSVIMYFSLRDLINMFEINEVVARHSFDYGRMIVIGGFFVIGSMVLHNCLRSEGSANYSMVAMGVGSLINIILDPILIFTFDMGIWGAGLATLISQLFAFCLLLFYYMLKKSVVRLDIRYFSFDLDIYREIFKIGLPTFFRQLLSSVAVVLFNKQAAIYGGDSFLAALGIAVKVTTIPLYFVFGYGQGVQTVVGYNYGAGNISRVKNTVMYGFLSTLLGSILFSVSYLLLSNQIVSIFRPPQHVMTDAILLIKVILITIVFLSISNTIGVFFQAIGKGFTSLILSISRQGIFFIPIILILPKYYNLNGIIISQPFADLATLVLSFSIFLPYFWGKGLKNDIIRNRI